MSSPGDLSGDGGSREAPRLSALGLLGAPCARFRRRPRPAFDRGSRARRSWRQSHGPDVHRRPLRRFSLPPASPRRLCQSADFSHVADGLALQNAYIAAALRCSPPDNKPLPSELANCAGYLEKEFELLKPRAVLALGAIAFHAYLRLLVHRGN